MKKLSVFAALCGLSLGICSMAAHAQEVVHSQTLYFNGNCTGTDETSDRPFSPTFTGKVFGGDITVFENPSGGINYAFAGIAGGTNIILWAGPKETHVRADLGFAGFDTPTASGYSPGAFPVTAATQITFDLSCSDIGAPWQAFVTIWYVIP